MDPEPPVNPYGVSSQFPMASAPANPGTDSTGGVIPYKNPHALIAYYLAVFSILPLIGIFLSLPAFILGVIGLRNRNRNPQIRGSAHAWIGIIMGGMMTLVWGSLLILLLSAAFLRR